MTNEHVFAKWVKDAFSSLMLPARMEQRRDGLRVWAYDGDPLEQKVKAVCSTCNNGWMSKLEVSAGAILQPMLNAERVPVSLGYSAQVKVAAWTTKTAMVLQYLHPAATFIPSADYRDFFLRQQPSTQVMVLIGARRSAENTEGTEIFEYQERFVGTAEQGIHHIHFALGALYFGLTLFAGRKRRFPRFMDERAGLCTQVVWPVQARGIVWPPVPIDNVGGVRGMFAAWANAKWL